MADGRPVVLSKRMKVKIKTGKLDVSQPKQETDCDSQQGACRSEGADLPAIYTVDYIAKNRRPRSSGNSCLLLPQDICLFCDKQRRRNRKGNEKLSKCSYDAGENSIISRSSKVKGEGRIQLPAYGFPIVPHSTAVTIATVVE